MRSKIENQWIEVEADSLGGELAGIRNKENNLEYLWQGDPAVWGRRAPVLFPNAGQVCDNQIILDGKGYPGKKHGFARDLDFVLAAQTENSLTYRLTDSPETRAFYPYAFTLELSYTVEGHTLECGYLLQNPNEVPLPFGIGGHPAFRCPIEPEKESYTDYEVVLEQPCTAQERLSGAGGLLTGETQPAFPGQTTIPLVKGLFDNDSFLLDGLVSQTVTLRSRKTGHAVVLDRKDLPYFLIWSVPGAIPFLCLEAWQALPDRENADHDFLHKEGNLILRPGETYRGGYTIGIL